jgi:hypothetical protein
MEQPIEVIQYNWSGCCILRWVDIGTGARVLLKFVEYLKKVGKIKQKFV